MKKSVPAANPDAYVAALRGWRRDTVEALRAAVRSAGGLQEVIKWTAVELDATMGDPTLAARR